MVKLDKEKPSLMDNALRLFWGEPSKVKKGEKITVYLVSGCMAESLKYEYEGLVVRNTRIKCNGAPGDGKIPAVEILVTASNIGKVKPGDVKVELSDKLRTLEKSNIKIIAK